MNATQSEIRMAQPLIDHPTLEAIRFKPPRTDLLDESLTIERFRELSIDWDSLISGRALEEPGTGRLSQSFATAPSIRYFSTYFAALWGLEKDEDFKVAVEKKDQFFQKGTWKKPVIDTDPKKDPTFQDVADHYALKHPITEGRVFLLETVTAKPIEDKDFESFASFLNMMQEKVVAVTTVPSGTEVEAKRFLSEIEQFDFAPSLIMRQYKELMGLRDAADALSSQADGAVPSGKDAQGGLPYAASLLEADQIDALIDGIMRMKQPKIDTELGLANLAFNASQLGYFLALTDIENPKLIAGNLYKRIDAKTVYVTRYERGSLFGLVKNLLSPPPLPIPLKEILPQLFADEDTVQANFEADGKAVGTPYMNFNPLKDVFDIVTAPFQPLLNPGQILRDPVGSALGVILGPTAAVVRHFTKSQDGTVIGVTIPESYVPVAVDLDPWFEKEKRLEGEGLRSFRFTKIGAAYRCETGESLFEIMLRCDRDEQFRRETAVWIPQYEQNPTRGERLVRYIIYKRPYMGIRSVRMPRLMVRETLAYHTGWRGVEIGELVQAINLAPLEERTITIERRQSRRREEIRSASSIFDLTSTDSSEFTQEIEKEVSRTTTTEVGGGAKASFGPISGGVDAKSSTTNFARDMERTAKKAAKSMVRNLRQEIRISTTNVEEASQAEITGAKIRNINEGRTLNLSLFQIYNLYAADTRLKNLEFVVESGVEVIAGSQLTLPRTVPAGDVRWALSAFEPSVLPISITRPVDHYLYPKIYARYWDYILRQLREMIGEYFGEDQPLGELGDSDGDAFLDASKPLTPIKDAEIAESYGEVQERLSAIGKLLRERLAARDPADNPLWPHQIRVPSSGMYMDSTVGEFPATELYSEEMRALQRGLKAAEVTREEALGRYYDRLDGNGFLPTWTAKYVGKLLTVEVPAGSPKGSWALFINDEPVALATLKQGGTSLGYELGTAPGAGASLAIKGPGVPFRPIDLT